MPLTPRAIADRKATCTFSYAGEPVTITYYAGRITSLTKEAVEAKQAELTTLAERGDAAGEIAARRYLAAWVLDYLTAWEGVVESVADDGTPGPLLPLDVETLATLDPDFLIALLRAMVADTQAGKATGTTPSAS